MESHQTGAATGEVRQLIATIDSVTLSGVISAHAYLTPPTIQRTRRIGVRQHWEFVLDARTRSVLIASLNHGIYWGGGTFPGVCSACMGPAEQFALVEAGVRVDQWPSTLAFQNMTQQQLDRVTAACLERRFWYRVPYCRRHILSTQAVHIESNLSTLADDWHLTFMFSNHEYGRLFGEINGICGVWVDWPTLLKRGGFILVGAAIAMPGVLFAIANGWELKYAHRNGLTVGLQLLHLGGLLLGLVAGIAGGSLCAVGAHLGRKKHKPPSRTPANPQRSLVERDDWSMKGMCVGPHG